MARRIVATAVPDGTDPVITGASLVAESCPQVPPWRVTVTATVADPGSGVASVQFVTGGMAPLSMVLQGGDVYQASFDAPLSTTISGVVRAVDNAGNDVDAAVELFTCAGGTTVTTSGP